MTPGRPVLRAAAALFGRYFIAGLAMWLLVFGLPLLPLLGGAPNAPVPAGALLLLMTLGGVFAGALLGWRVSMLWGGDMLSIVPGYRRALLSVTVAMGIVLITGPLLLAVALHPPLATPPVIKLLLLTACAQVGAGLTWGFYMPRRVPWWARVMLVLLPVVWFNLVPGLTLPDGGPWARPSWGWGVYHPITVLGLLLSPLSWPWLLTRHGGTLLSREDRAQVAFTNRLTGTAFDGWLWQRLAPFLGLGRRAWGHWLVLRSAALGQLWAASLASLVMLVVHQLFGMPVPMLAWTLYVSCVAAFGIGAPVQAGLVGRALLLPGGARRSSWPRWLASHHAGAMGVGAAVVWLPALLAAHGAGLGLGDTLVLLAAVACTLAASVVWTLFSVVRRAGPGRRPAAGIGWLLATVAFVVGAASCVLLRAPSGLQAAAVAAAFIWLGLLAGLALSGARRCTFDR